LDNRARRVLPRHVYRPLLRGCDGARRLAGRNPGRGRLLPDFVIIGAAKAGTTSLFDWVSEHPFVTPACRKEVHYFDYNSYRGEDWYRGHFPLGSEREVFAAEHGRGFLAFEASPSYISHYWAPERLKRTLPAAKLIVALRNPVERAHSQFQMSRLENEEPLDDFAAAVAVEDQRLGPERARMLADPNYNSWPIGCWSYLMRSRYAEQLERWFALYERDRFHFVTLEEMADDAQSALDRLHEFLGLPAHRYEQLGARHIAPRREALDPEVRASLNEYFRPHNERLYELVGRDFGWER